MTTLYKIVGMDGEPLHGGAGKWALPSGKRAGKWMPKVANVTACIRGYHLIPGIAIIDWLPPSGVAGRLFKAEGRGEQNSDEKKVAFAEARLLQCVGILDEVSMRLAAADFAERALPIFEKEHPKDERPREAIQAARDFALGKINVAAWAAARDAARDAAWAAAWDAARDAALAAARDAARAAARDAAWAAAWDAARDAALAAARDAARDAAFTAAWDAARGAAWDAARDAHSKIILTRAAERLREVPA